MPLAGRDRVLASTSESEFQEHVFSLAARGGWHGVHIRVSHGTLEGLHGLKRAFPRAAHHDDAWGVPDLLLVHPERRSLLLPELKPVDGIVSDHQQRWLHWLADIVEVEAPLWRPTDETTMRTMLLGGKA